MIWQLWKDCDSFSLQLDEPRWYSPKLEFSLYSCLFSQVYLKTNFFPASGFKKKIPVHTDSVLKKPCPHQTTCAGCQVMSSARADDTRAGDITSKHQDLLTNQKPGEKLWRHITRRGSKRTTREYDIIWSVLLLSITLEYKINNSSIWQLSSSTQWQSKVIYPDTSWSDCPFKWSLDLEAQSLKLRQVLTF